MGVSVLDWLGVTSCCSFLGHTQYPGLLLQGLREELAHLAHLPMHFPAFSAWIPCVSVLERLPGGVGTPLSCGGCCLSSEQGEFN